MFRIGGDEFAVILQNDDYTNRAGLVQRFEHESDAINAESTSEWTQVRTAMGIAEYDPAKDQYVIDTVRRADKIMYANKQSRKTARG